MKHKHVPKAHISRVMVAVLVGVIAVPTAMTGLFQSTSYSDAPMLNLRHEAASDVGRVRFVRRNYWTAVDIYKELTRLGYEDLTPPDINDPESIAFYLDSSNFDVEVLEAVHGSAPEEESIDPEYLVTISQTQHTYNMLPQMWRDLIDGYVDTQFCAPTLSQYTVRGNEDIDLYDLCVRILDERIAAISPNLLERSAYLRGFNSVGFAPLRNLKNRLEVLQESLLYEGGTSARPRYHDGSRPRLDYSQYRN